jgi:GNAT superfamily N-acetyltransferase
MTKRTDSTAKPSIVVRPRIDADVDALVEIARVVHQRDGYPVYLPTDLRAFLASPSALGAWVAEHGGAIVGHVALHPRSFEGAMEVATAALQVSAERLAVVARLVVAPTARRDGVGRRLLETATAEAHTRKLWPILDVGVGLTGAIRFYEASGWTCVGEAVFRGPNDFVVDELVYVGPQRA